MNLFNPKGNRYNSEDPLGLLQKEKEIEEKLKFPSPVTLFIENEARKRDERRSLLVAKPTQIELLYELEEIIKSMIGMVVTFETKRGYLHGRVVGVGAKFFNVELRGTKNEMIVDFDETLRLGKNYA